MGRNRQGHTRVANPSKPYEGWCGAQGCRYRMQRFPSSISLARYKTNSGLVFPSPSRAGKPLSDMTLTKVLRTTGLAERTTVHGFRSSFRDWCAETGKTREIAEAALAHSISGVEGAYFRSDLFDQRRRLMADWAGYLSGADAKVVQLRG